VIRTNPDRLDLGSLRAQRARPGRSDSCIVSTTYARLRNQQQMCRTTVERPPVSGRSLAVCVPSRVAPSWLAASPGNDGWKITSPGRRRTTADAPRSRQPEHPSAHSASYRTGHPATRTARIAVEQRPTRAGADRHVPRRPAAHTYTRFPGRRRHGRKLKRPPAATSAAQIKITKHRAGSASS
jgi:hypothetical protein